MLNRIKVGVLFLGWLLCSGLTHPYHVSIIQVDHSAKAHRFEFTFKLFTDDMEAALIAQGTDKIYLGESNEHVKADEYLFTYLKNGFSITADSTELELRWVGKEVVDDITWAYCEVRNQKAPKTVSIDVDLLTELLQDHKNIVHVKVGGIEQSEAMNRTNHQIEFKY
jgi:hypothetical protein